MALTTCPECNKQVSDNADTCPNCAYPLTGGGSTQAHGGKIQTVEQRSKRYKLQQLLSCLLIIGSIMAVMFGFSGDDPSPGISAFGTLGIVVGLIWFIIVRFLMWWHHA